jgi:hypothetical protein
MIAELIEQIAAKFADGLQVVELPVVEAERDKLRRRLTKACRRRGLGWRFALTTIGVAVVRR